jgi:ketosteroid isomerase-like protein
LTDQNKQVVTRFFELFSAGKAKEAFALVAPNVKWWVPESLPFGGTFDRAGYLTKVLPQFVGFKGGMKLTVKSMIAEGDTVAVEVESYGVHACGEPDGFVYNNKYHFQITLHDGLFVEVKEYMDTYHLAELYAVTQTEACKAKLTR